MGAAENIFKLHKDRSLLFRGGIFVSDDDQSRPGMIPRAFRDDGSMARIDRRVKIGKMDRLAYRGFSLLSLTEVIGPTPMPYLSSKSSISPIIFLAGWDFPKRTSWPLRNVETNSLKL